MKKAIILLAVTVITVCLFVSCSAKNSGSGDNSTTAITDVNGETHYYETVTDENGEVVTDKDGNYVTKENTTNFNNEEKDVSISGTKKTDAADNEVSFNHPYATTTQEPTTHITISTESTTQKETAAQSVTDKDGWINKWY